MMVVVVIIIWIKLITELVLLNTMSHMLLSQSILYASIHSVLTFALWGGHY